MAESGRSSTVNPPGVDAGLIGQGVSSDPRLSGAIQISRAPAEKSVASQQQGSSERLQSGGFWKQWGKGVGAGLLHIVKGALNIPIKAVTYAASAARIQWSANTGFKAAGKALGCFVAGAVLGALSGAAEVLGGVAQTASSLVPVAALKDAFGRSVRDAVAAENAIREQLGQAVEGGLISQTVKGSELNVLDAMVEYAARTDNPISKDKLAMYINVGERLARALNDDATASQEGFPKTMTVDGVKVTANETAITAISWFLASQTVKEHGIDNGTFQSGAYVFQDNRDGNFAEFMKSGMSARGHSHCKAFGGEKPKGFGLEAGRRELPGKGGALLMVPLPQVGDQPRTCFMKFEETGVPNPFSSKAQSSVEKGNTGGVEARTQALTAGLHHLQNYVEAAIKPTNSKLDKCTKGSLGPATRQYLAGLDELAVALAASDSLEAKEQVSQLNAGIKAGKVGFALMVRQYEALVEGLKGKGSAAQDAALDRIGEAVDALRSSVSAYQSGDPRVEAGRMAAEIRLGSLG